MKTNQVFINSSKVAVSLRKSWAAEPVKRGFIRCPLGSTRGSPVSSAHTASGLPESVRTIPPVARPCHTPGRLTSLEHHLSYLSRGIMFIGKILKLIVSIYI